MLAMSPGDVLLHGNQELRSPSSQRLSVSPFTWKVEHNSLQSLTNTQQSVDLYAEYDKSPRCLQIAQHTWNEKDDTLSLAKWRVCSHSTRRGRVTMKALHSHPLR